MARERGPGGLTRLVIRWVANAAAIWVAFEIVPGITPLDNSIEALAITALVFGLVNALIRPFVILLTCPLIILTLGLGTLLVNAGMFVLAGNIGQRFGVGFTVDGFWAALIGAVVVSIVSVILSSLLGDRKQKDRD